MIKRRNITLLLKPVQQAAKGGGEFEGALQGSSLQKGGNKPKGWAVWAAAASAGSAVLHWMGVYNYRVIGDHVHSIAEVEFLSKLHTKHSN